MSRTDRSLVTFDSPASPLSVAASSPKAGSTQYNPGNPFSTATSPTNEHFGGGGGGGGGTPSPSLGLPRKSFLLKDLLAAKPCSYQPKYVHELSLIPKERWVQSPPSHHTKQRKWAAQENARLKAHGDMTAARSLFDGSLLEQQQHQRDEEEERQYHHQSSSSDDDDRSPNKSKSHRLDHTSKGSARGGEYDASRLYHPSMRSLPPPPPRAPSPIKKGMTPDQQRAILQQLTIQSTPLLNGVQAAWDSSAVQQGPFRALVFYQHPDGGGGGGGEGGDGANHDNHHTSSFATTTTPPRPISRGSPSSTLIHSTGAGSRSPTAFGATTTSNISNPHATTSAASHARAMHFALPPLDTFPPPPPTTPFYAHHLPPRRPKLRDGSDDATPMEQCVCRSMTVECKDCAAVRQELDAFDNVREEKEERLYQNQLQIWQEKQAREEESKNVPPDMMRTKSGRLLKRLVILDEGPSIGQLYHGTSHLQREALYVTTCGGLSFDITKEKFSQLVQKVLAPRIHVRVSDEQLANMFALFDHDKNGSVSYFEYLSTLCVSMLTLRQRTLLATIFRQLYMLPFYTSGASAQQRTKELHDHQEQMRMEGFIESAPLDVGMSHPLMSSSSPQRSGSVVAGGGAGEGSGSPGKLRRVASTIGSLRRSTSSMATRRLSQSGLDASRRGTTLLGKKPEKDNQAGVVFLRKPHFTRERLRSVVYEVLQHNMWFPHPADDEFVDAILKCFAHLREGDFVNCAKFRMFVFCDDACMAALETLAPGGEE